MNVKNKPGQHKMENTLADFDVIISSKLKLVRNLTDNLFPGSLSEEDRATLMARLSESLQQLPGEDGFNRYTLETIEPILLKHLQEQNLLDPEYYYTGQNPILINHHHTIIAQLCRNEHLQLYSIRQGCNLRALYRELDQLDSRLENHLDYACSLEWGYHNSSLTTLGTGLRASVLLHLPALVVTSLVEDVKNSLSRNDLNLTPLYTEEKSSFGSLYLVSNQLSFGLSEEEILENLLRSLAGVISLERKSRQELLKNNRIELEDRIFRAMGTLKHARIISFKEAIEHLSFLRMGICCGVIDNLDLEDITSLFFLLREEHIKKLINKFDTKEKDSPFIDKMRGKIIRDLLEKDDDFGGKLCLKD